MPTNVTGLPRIIILVMAAAAGGMSLGYVQDQITKHIVPLFVPPFAGLVYVAGLLGWTLYVLWHSLAVIDPDLRRKGIQPHPDGLIFMLTLYGFTIAGGISYFLLNGMDKMTLQDVAFYSATTGTTYNFVLVIVPQMVVRGIRTARLKLQPSP